MSLGSQISAFCKDVKKHQEVWLIEFEEDQFLEWIEEDGTRVLPIWSTESRVERTLQRLDQFGNGTPCGFTFDSFVEEWLPELKEAGIKLGPNWAGDNLTGTTLFPDELIGRIERC
ncbi:DUF2750 domain-containing protein [Paraglaciecola chathamensis]|uniref:DUF2750 domain-containing protein n=2 Tax=Paraglaciecola chathamensis TaxID=368405 RepID=A0ABQ0IB18_9ALTE|nr:MULTISPECIES: DUF2750 domain-containing protein [Paraglaciecola]GAC06453.1 hypothetical protein GAGA_3620 [Paraglaciecola agarilytica NO2]GAC12002.1 hypothetical protein GCHA_4076 [Paraglaciecola chathamensis S18K6]